MSDEDLVMVIRKPHFIVKLHTTMLEVDLKKGVRKELEDALEAKPALRHSLGFLFQTIVPLDIELKDIDSVKVDKKGQVKVAIPDRRDLFIPLKPDESRRLVEKMNELIVVEKDRAEREALESERVKKEYEPKLARARAEAESAERMR